MNENDKRVLKLGEGVELDAQKFIVGKLAILGKSGSGKSGCIKVIIEEMCRLGIPFIVIDPIGIHWGIRSSFDGKGKGFPVLVIGGKHGDVEIDRAAGREIARKVVEERVSCVVDLLGMTKSAQAQFLSDFADELLNVNDRPRHVLLEEAHLFIPQHPFSEMRPCFHAMDNLITIGRNQALGFTIASQRPARLHWNALSQADTLVAFLLIAMHDRVAAENWVKANADRAKIDEFMAAIGGLQPREAWVWSPSVFQVFKQFRTRDFTTFHADKDHLDRMGWLDVKPVKTDIGAVAKAMGKVVAEAVERKALEAQTKKGKGKGAPDPRAQETYRKLAPAKSGPQIEEALKLEKALARTKERVSKLEEENQALKEISSGSKKSLDSHAKANVADRVAAIRLRKELEGATEREAALRESVANLREHYDALRRSALEVWAKVGTERREVEALVRQAAKLTEKANSDATTVVDTTQRVQDALSNVKFGELPALEVKKLGPPLPPPRPTDQPTAPSTDQSTDPPTDPPTRPSSDPSDIRPIRETTRRKSDRSDLDDLPAHLRVLAAAADLQAGLGDPPLRVQVAAYAGVKPAAGHFQGTLRQLRDEGLIEVIHGEGRFRVTEAGFKAVGTRRRIKAKEFRDKVLAAVGGRSGDALQILVDRYPNSISRVDLAATLGTAPTAGHFQGILAPLIRFGLAEVAGQGTVKAADLLFPKRRKTGGE